MLVFNEFKTRRMYMSSVDERVHLNNYFDIVMGWRPSLGLVGGLHSARSRAMS